MNVSSLSSNMPAISLVGEVKEYIEKGWPHLIRNWTDAADTKIEGNNVLYYPSGDPKVEQIVDRQLAKPLPEGEVKTHGLLYLPEPYVVPGGRFNEMYGWDSYFQTLGLLEDDQWKLAVNTVENYSYQIEYYGKILNANRTYYLHRSQPPFYTRTIMEVFNYAQKHDWLGKGEAFWKEEWLLPKLPLIEKYYEYWTQEPQLTKETGLSRYYDTGTGPAPESQGSEVVDGENHYDRLKARLRVGSTGLSQPLSTYYDEKTNALTEETYVRDRSMRASGLDPSFRWGAGNLDAIDYNTVDLNCLLYQMEKDAAELAGICGNDGMERRYKRLAMERRTEINKWLWDEEAGLFKDYNIATGDKLDYPFATMFWPLWCGLATESQAKRIREYLGELEEKGGLKSSNKTIDGQWTGCQWDAPWGWAPMQMMAVAGLNRYGFEKDAERIAYKFCKSILIKFARTGVIFEKYDVVHSHKERGNKRYKPVLGYDDNVIGFGWTNAAFQVFYRGLSQECKDKLERFGARVRPESQSPNTD